MNPSLSLLYNTLPHPSPPFHFPHKDPFRGQNRLGQVQYELTQVLTSGSGQKVEIVAEISQI